MDIRQQRGLAISESLTITRKDAMWIVPSQSGKAPYLVDLNPDNPRCSCPDYEMRGMKCKHIFAVEFTITTEASDVEDYKYSLT
jgi:hypothetical protein